MSDQFMSNAKQVNDADIEEIVNEWKYNFRMVEDDHYAVNISIKAMYYMLKSDNLDPKVIQAIGKFIEAARNLPKAPEDINLCIELSITDNGEYPNTETYSFRLNQEFFHIDATGIERGPYGSDSYDKPSWYIERTGGRQCDLELAFFENEIIEFINMGAKITVEDY